MTYTQSKIQKKAYDCAMNFPHLLTEEVSKIMYQDFRVLNSFRTPAMLVVYRSLDS